MVINQTASVHHKPKFKCVSHTVGTGVLDMKKDKERKIFFFLHLSHLFFIAKDNLEQKRTQWYALQLSKSNFISPAIGRICIKDVAGDHRNVDPLLDRCNVSLATIWVSLSKSSKNCQEKKLPKIIGNERRFRW